jgi:hypothetical protein
LACPGQTLYGCAPWRLSRLSFPFDGSGSGIRCRLGGLSRDRVRPELGSAPGLAGCDSCRCLGGVACVVVEKGIALARLRS